MRAERVARTIGVVCRRELQPVDGPPCDVLALLHAGAVLVNARGERFMRRVDPDRMERAPADVVVAAAAAEILARRCTSRGAVIVDATHLGAEPLRIEVAPASTGHDAMVAFMHDENRELLRMRMDLRGEIPPPTWPEGSHVRGFHPSDGPRLHALLDDGYRHGGGSVDGLDSWLPALVGDSEFDPRLCFLVEAGDELVAGAICWTSAFVKDIVVREAWRRHGLGEALLRLAFRTFQERGATHVELKVQGQNAPAIRLYERVGMRTIERLTDG